MQVLDEMKILIQQAHDKLNKQGKLLNEKETAEVKWIYKQIKADNEIEKIYFTSEEEELFRLLDEARLPVLIRSNLVNTYLEMSLSLAGHIVSLPRNEG